MTAAKADLTHISSMCRYQNSGNDHSYSLVINNTQVNKSPYRYQRVMSQYAWDKHFSSLVWAKGKGKRVKGLIWLIQTFAL
jgi:hypothetical protein